MRQGQAHLNNVKLMAKQLISKYAPYEYKFAWCKTRRAVGRCHYVKKEIQLSKGYTRYNDIDTMRKVVLHEIAHALTPGERHSSIWRQAARRLGLKNPKSTTQVNPIPGKYQYECPVCGAVIHLFRKPKYAFSCGKCTKVYDEAYRMVRIR